MEFIIKCLVIVVFIGVVAACSEPVVFGVPESVWNCLSVLQQQEVIEQYNQQKIHDPNKCCLMGDAQKNIYRCKNKTCFRTLPYPYHTVGSSVAYP